MLKRLLLVLALSLGTVLPALADAISDMVIANLKAQGFAVVQMDRTWLGRMWVLARNSEVQREVVFNPVTGEILRDYTVLLATLNAPDQRGSDRTAASSGAPAMGGTPPFVSSGETVSPELEAAKARLSAPINPVQ